MLRKKHSTAWLITNILITLVILGAAGWVVLNRQRVIDQINYWHYTPSTLMASFVQRSSMNDEGKFLFYSAQPSLQEKQQFSMSCPGTNPDIAILGCYDGSNIYIYNVNNTQLDGIREVTSAYEMLHAAYKRLSDSDRNRLDGLIEAEYAKQSTPDMQSIVTYFATSEPGQRDNELFSIIATELPSISPDLESYFTRYFVDRQVLVSLYEKYSGVFTSLKNQAKTLYDQLTTMGATINTQSAQYVSDSNALSADISTFNKNADSGNFSSNADFNRQHAALVARSNALEETRASINQEVADYNALLTQYQKVAVQNQALQNSITGTVAPVPSV